MWKFPFSICSRVWFTLIWIIYHSSLPATSQSIADNWAKSSGIYTQLNHCKCLRARHLVTTDKFMTMTKWMRGKYLTIHSRILFYDNIQRTEKYQNALEFKKVKVAQHYGVRPKKTSSSDIMQFKIRADDGASRKRTNNKKKKEHFARLICQYSKEWNHNFRVHKPHESELLIQNQKHRSHER